MELLVVISVILSTTSVIVAFAVLTFSIVEFRRLTRDHKAIMEDHKAIMKDHKLIAEALERIASRLGSGR